MKVTMKELGLKSKLRWFLRPWPNWLIPEALAVTAEDYPIVVDCESRTIQEVYEYLKDDYRR